MSPDKAAYAAADEIIADMAGRIGLGSTWSECPLMARAKIRAAWAAIILKALYEEAENNR